MRERLPSPGAAWNDEVVWHVPGSLPMKDWHCVVTDLNVVLESPYGG